MAKLTGQKLGKPDLALCLSPFLAVLTMIKDLNEKNNIFHFLFLNFFLLINFYFRDVAYIIGNLGNIFFYT